MAASLMLRRTLRCLARAPALETTTPFPPILRPRHFSSSFPPPTVRSGAAADVLEPEGGVEEEEPILFPGGFVAVSPTAKTMAAPSLLQPRVVIYDGVCHLCHRGVKWVIGADKHRKIKFCCVQSKAAEPYLALCGLERQDVLKRFVFVEGLGEYHEASSAALRVLAYLPFPYSALSALWVVPTPIRDAVYDYVAKRRYDWLGKADECLVLRDKELLERFIDRDEMIGRS